jgi:hypothetical protein
MGSSTATCYGASCSWVRREDWEIHLASHGIVELDTNRVVHLCC